MAQELKLYKKQGTYVDKKDGKTEKSYTNFYIQCNDKLIPIEIKYFPNEKFEGRDPGYSGRKAVLETFAEVLPEKNAD